MFMIITQTTNLSSFVDFFLSFRKAHEITMQWLRGSRVYVVLIDIILMYIVKINERESERERFLLRFH